MNKRSISVSGFLRNDPRLYSPILPTFFCFYYLLYHAAVCFIVCSFIRCVFYIIIPAFYLGAILFHAPFFSVNLPVIFSIRAAAVHRVANNLVKKQQLCSPGFKSPFAPQCPCCLGFILYFLPKSI